MSSLIDSDSRLSDGGSPEDETGKALRLLLESSLSPVSLPKRDRKETIMHMVQRYDPAFQPTASTIRGRERQAGKRLCELYAAREAEITSPPASDGRNKLPIHRLIAPKPPEIKDA